MKRIVWRVLAIGCASVALLLLCALMVHMLNADASYGFVEGTTLALWLTITVAVCLRSVWKDMV